MEVQLQNISKRYLYDWIIRDLDYTFLSGSITGVNGINGSGKSTLIKIISGWLSPSEGSIIYRHNGERIKRDTVYKHVSIAAPYTDVILEYNLMEMYQFHTKFRKLGGLTSFEEFRDVVNLKGHSTKPLQYYSSGMKQRVQLSLALLSDTNLLLLDEPTSFLDTANKRWFYDLLQQNISGKTVIISSNDDEDFEICGTILDLSAKDGSS